jgi:hypothetical protein
MVILINSVDRSNAVKILAGVYEQICGNDLVILHGFYVKHIGNINFKIDLNKITDYTIRRYHQLENLNPIQLIAEVIAKLRRIVYLDKERIEQLKELPNRLEMYRAITNWIPKKYNINYFEKLQYLYNLLV